MPKRKSDSELGKVYAPGEAIVSEGEAGETMFVIQAGKVEVVKQMEGREVQLGTMGPGDFFGEMALFQQESRAATVRAIGDVRALTIDRRTLLRRIEQDPLLAYNLVEGMADRLRVLHQRLRDAIGESDTA